MTKFLSPLALKMECGSDFWTGSQPSSCNYRVSTECASLVDCGQTKDGYKSMVKTDKSSRFYEGAVVNP